MTTTSLFTLIDFSGVAVAAVGGALEAREDLAYNYDFIGVLGLGFVSALGGGITRDLILQHGPPLAFVDVCYILIALSGALFGLLAASRFRAHLRAFIVPVDAAALALFAVSGATRALNNGLSALPALLLGVTTAVGGGAWRDVLSGRPPRVFESGELYALVAIAAAALFLLLEARGLPRGTSTWIAVAAGFGLRLASLQLGWRTKAVRDS